MDMDTNGDPLMCKVKIFVDVTFYQGALTLTLEIFVQSASHQLSIAALS